MVERRRYRRLPVRLAVSCKRSDSPRGQLYSAHTVNVSPGGLLVEISGDVFEVGNLLCVELFIPPTRGLLEQGGRMSGLARVVRVEGVLAAGGLFSGKYGVAVEFCRAPRLSI